MSKMKDKAIVATSATSTTKSIMAGLKKVNGMEVINIKPQYDEFKFPDGHSVMILAEGRFAQPRLRQREHPSFVMSASFTNQVLAQLDLKDNASKYEKKVYMLPKKLDEEVARCIWIISE